MTTIKAPFFEIGPKSYLYGDEILELAQAADAASAIRASYWATALLYNSDFLRM